MEYKYCRIVSIEQNYLKGTDIILRGMDFMKIITINEKLNEVINTIKNTINNNTKNNIIFNAGMDIIKINCKGIDYWDITEGMGIFYEFSTFGLNKLLNNNKEER